MATLSRYVFVRSLHDLVGLLQSMGGDRQPEVGIIRRVASLDNRHVGVDVERCRSAQP